MRCQVLAFAKAMADVASRVLTPLGEPVQMRIGAWLLLLHLCSATD
jgi:hypothetical protein